MKKNKLPCPRLELLWDKEVGERICTYTLVIPLKEGDIRRQNSKGKDVRKVLKLKIGKTFVNGGVSIQNGVVEAPYRDGSHALWDSKALGIPAYAVCGETFTRIIQRRK
jgi:hypothetical protein